MGGRTDSYLAVHLLDDVSKPAQTVAAALEKAGKQAKAVAKAMADTGATSRFVGTLGKLGLAGKDIEKVAAAWRDYAKSAGLASDASLWTKTQVADVRRWESQTITALRRVQREQAQFSKSARKSAEEATRGSVETKGHGGAGGGLGHFVSRHMLGALTAGYSVEKALESGAHLQHERVRQAASGMSAAEIMDAAAESARIAAKFPSLKLYDVNHMLRNARAIVGSYTEAADIVEPMAKLRVIAQGARPGADVSEDFDQLIKGLEIKGVTQSPKQFREYLEGIAKGLNVFGDTLKPYQYYEMFKYGRQATSGLSSNFILGTAPTLAQELGGSSYGNAVAGFNRAIVGGRMEHSSLKELYRIGLAQKQDLDFLKNGEVKGLKPGHAIKGWEVAQEDPNRWVREYFLPALVHAGITSSSEVQKEASTVFSNKVAAQMVSILATQQSRIDKDLALLRGAPGLSAADNYLRNDPTIAMASLKNSIDGLTATLTAGTMKALAPVMSDLAGAIARYTARLAAMDDHDSKHPGETPLFQKQWNRVFNGLVNGVDSDKAQSEFTVSERNDINYAKAKARLERMRDEEDPTAPKPSKERSARYPEWARPSLTMEDESRRYPYRRSATKQLAEIEAAHRARLAAEKKLTDFRRNLPRDMTMRGEGSDHVVVTDGTFGMPSLGRRGAPMFTYGGGPTTVNPYGGLAGAKAAMESLNQTVKPKIDTSGLDAVSTQLSSILGQINQLRAGVTVPVKMSVSGNMPSLGAVNRSSFQASGDPGR